VGKIDASSPAVGDFAHLQCPAAARGPGEQMRFSGNAGHMHLIDPPTDTVL